MCACTYVLMCVCVRVCAKRSAIRPNSQLLSDLKAWVETKKNFTVFGAPYQADAQMMYLMKKFRWIQGVIRCVCPCPCSCVYVMCMLCVYVHVCVRTYDSEDSDFWTMGAREWHAGYSTRSRKRYRHVIHNETKSRFVGEMPTAERLVEVVCATHPQTVTCLFDLVVCCVFTRSCNPNPRIRFAMWTGNDYLPSFQGVGWQKAKELHKKFEALNDAEEEVRMCTHTLTCLRYMCGTPSHLLWIYSTRFYCSWDSLKQ